MKKVLASVLFIISMLSCSLPVLRSGQAELEFTLGGVLPNISSEDIAYAGASRAITPNSLMVRAVITGEGYSRTFTTPVLAATTLLTGLPAFKELSITLEALDFEGVVTTSWTGTATLNPGRNGVKAVLKPIGTIATFTVGPNPVSIPFGKAQFYRYNPDTNGETFIYIDTNSPERLWLAVYNENWEPLDTIAESRGDGWAVINRDTTPVLYVAIANMRSTGYPPKERSYILSYKAAHFVSKTGNQDNPGTSARPWDFAGLANQLADNSDDAFLIAAGTYDTLDGLTLYGATWIFGGFDPSDWKKRSPRSTTLETNGSNSVLTINNYDSPVLLDGLSMKTNYATDTSRALYYNGSGGLSIIDCNISGTQIQGISSNLNSVALLVNLEANGTIYILSSNLTGGNVSTSGNQTVTLKALDVPSNALVNVVLLFCQVDGGTITAMNATSPLVALETRAINNAGGNVDTASNTTVTASRIYGGTIRASANARTTALASATYTNVIVASSVLNAGYINYSGTSGNIWMTAIGNYSTGDTASLLVIGSIIDAGYFETTNQNANAIGLEQQSSIGTIAGSVFVTNNTSSGETVVTPIYLMSASQPVLYDCAFIGPVKDAYNYNSYSGTGSFIEQEGTELLFPNASQDLLFVSYVKPVSSSTFFANSWRPAGMLAGVKTTTPPSDWGINMDTLGMYPFLIVDLANRLRPMNAGWSIGPYQN